MSQYHRENPDQPSRHDWFEGAITGKTPEGPISETPPEPCKRCKGLGYYSISVPKGKRAFSVRMAKCSCQLHEPKEPIS